MTIKDFCEKHKACKEGYERAKHFKNMDDFFANSADHDDVIWACTRIMTKKERVQFSCWCVRQVWDLLTDERSRNAIIVGERYVQGLATDKELYVAADCAYVAIYDAPHDAAVGAAADAAYDAYEAAYAVSHYTADNVWTCIDTKTNQVEYLRNNFVFNWEG